MTAKKDLPTSPNLLLHFSNSLQSPAVPLFLPVVFFHPHKTSKSRTRAAHLFGEGHDGAGSDEAPLLAAEDGAGARGHARPVRGDQRQALLLVQELLGFLAISLRVFSQARLQTAPEHRRRRKFWLFMQHDRQVSWFTPEQTLQAEFKALQFVAQQVLLNQLDFLLLLQSPSTLPTTEPLTKYLWKL